MRAVMTTGWMERDGIDGVLKGRGSGMGNIGWEPETGAGDKDKSGFPIEQGPVVHVSGWEIEIVVCVEYVRGALRDRRAGREGTAGIVLANRELA